jgi:perosamine synthetase
VRHAVAVSSGTAGLHLCLHALGIGPGDEVVTSSFSFVASANAVLFTGATPVFAEVDPLTFNMDPPAVEAAITPRTKAILIVDIFGYPAEVPALVAIAERHGLARVEDACQTIDGAYDGKKLGTFGHPAVYGFYANKQLTTAEGGVVLTDDPDLARVLSSLRNQGRSDDGAWLVHSRLGFNYRLSDVHCAIGIPQVRRLEELLAARERVAAGYAERLSGLPVVLPSADDGDRHGWQAYVIQVERRDEVLGGLRAQGIQCQIGTYALHRLGAYRDQGAFPGADAAFERALALPLHPRLTDGELDRVAEGLDKLVSHH